MTIAPRIRRPAVAGYCYPVDPEALRHTIERSLQAAAPLSPTPARGTLVPHGSYRHTGNILGATLGNTVIPRRCILLGPSHVERWTSWSIVTDGAYRTPLGEVPIDAAGAEALRARCSFLSVDETWHRGEHAIEVVLPFLQHLGPADLSIVPIIIGAEDAAEWAQCAEALAQVIRMQEEPVLVIASSDFSHYLPAPETSARDRRLIDAIRTLDASTFTRAVREQTAPVCGAAAIACWLGAMTRLNATTATLAAYGTSADTGGDPHSAIGYAGLIVR
jgi:AmmeMemoRadiSam system protein B